MKLYHPSTPNRRFHQRAVSSLLAAAFPLLGALPAVAATDCTTPLQTYYVPFPAEQIKVWADNLKNDATNTDTILSVQSITITADDTVVCYDHWEDGFEDDLRFPAAGGTSEVWGDGEADNGCAPPPLVATCTDANDVLNAGDVVEIESSVPANPRGTAELYDGQDKFIASDPVKLSRAAWPDDASTTNTGSQLGGAVEVYDTNRWGTSFVSPVGEDISTNAAAWEWVALTIMARSDGTRLNVDLDGDGTDDLTDVPLDEGGSFLLEDVQVGTTVSSDAPIQVQVITADVGSNYQGRWYSLVPRTDWDNSYYAPMPYVGDGSGDGDTQVHLYNPGGSAITVNVDHVGGGADTTVNVGAGSVADYTMPCLAVQDPCTAANRTGGRFYTDDEADVFYAVSTVDAPEQIFDWGYTLVEERNLSASLVVGWAKGSVDTATNISPLWVTAVADTTLEIDLDGDGSCIEQVFLSALGVLRITDDTTLFPTCGNNDNDQTGMIITTSDALGGTASTQITGVWGQDPDVGSSGQPTQLDMGNVIVPSPVLVLQKVDELATDLDGNGKVDPGDVLLYTIRIYNNGDQDLPVPPASEILVFDNLNTQVTYVAGTTEILRCGTPSDGCTPDVLTPIADDVSPATTPFPLDCIPSDCSGNDDGYDLSSLDVGETAVISLMAYLDLDFSGTTVTNVTTAIAGGSQSATSSSTSPVAGGGLSIAKTSSVPSGDGVVDPGERITYTVTVTNDGQRVNENVVVYDAVPDGTTYDENSGTFSTRMTQTFSTAVTVRDEFDRLYEGSDGSNDWQTSWLEVDSAGAGPTAGEARVFDSRLRLNNDDGAGNESLAREVDLRGCTAATLTYDWDTSGTLEGTDDVTVTCGSTGVSGTFPTTLATYSDDSSGSASHDIASCISDRTAIRFQITDFYGGADEFFYADNVQIAATGCPGIKAKDLFDDVNYLNDDGTDVWSGAWTEANDDGDPAAGDVFVDEAGFLEISNIAGGTNPSISRSLDLSGCASASFTYRFQTNSDLGNGALEATDCMLIQASNNGGGSFSTLAIICDDQAAQQQTHALPFGTLSQDVVVRFQVQDPGDLTFEEWQVFSASVFTTGACSRVRDNYGTSSIQLADGDPSGTPSAANGLVVTGDGIDLGANDTLVITYDAVADDPLDNVDAGIFNLVTAESDQQKPITAFTLDQVSAAATRESAIGDRVWLDVDGDGVQDVGEPGIANVTVELRDGVCTPLPSGSADCPTTTTDLFGTYLFGNLVAGTYTVAVIDSTLPGGGAGLTAAPGTSDPTASITVATSEIYLDADFGYTNASSLTAIVGDRVWSDADGDGVQDPGEPGIGGVTVELRDGACTPSVDCPTTTTGADGSYVFAGVAPGEYTVAVDETSLPGGGADYTHVTGAQSPGNATPPFTVSGGEVYLDADFGYQNTTSVWSISDALWLDEDEDGLFDADERPFAGISVTLIDASSGDVVATTVSLSDGSFSFDGVVDDTYTIRVTDAGGELVSLDGTTSFAADGERTGIVVSGADVANESFGYNARGTIGDTVFSDSDQDGVQDPGELGIEGVTVELLDPGTLAVLDTAVTDPDGRYAFTGLLPGQYLTRVSTSQAALTGYTQTGDPDIPGNCGTAGSFCDSDGVGFLAASGSDLTLDYGFRQDYPDVSGTVFEDLDTNALQGGGESGFQGVTLELVKSYRVVDGRIDVDGDGDGDAADDGTAAGVTVIDGRLDLDGDGSITAADDGTWRGVTVVDGELDLDGDATAGETNGDDDGTVLGDAIAKTRTDADGDYTFTDVPGTAFGRDYRVVVTDDDRVLDGYQLTTGLDEYPVTVQTTDVTDVDFGYVRSPNTGSIGDTVWIDVDPPGAGGPDGLPGPTEPRLSMVVIHLYLDVDGDGVFEPGGDDGSALATTVTDAGGEYLFDGLGAGNYFVDVDGATLPPSLTTTVGTTDPLAVSLSEGERAEDADFGYRPSAGTGIIGDFVWYDADSDGLQDAGEAGIAGVDVTAIGAGPDGDFGTGDDTTATTTTAADGSYLFTGLAPDDYVVFFDPATLPAGVDTTPTNTGLDSTYNLSLAAGDVTTVADWGFDGGTFGTTGDRVWSDVNGDGDVDGGEPGIGGVTVNLIQDTNGDGVYDPDGADDTFGTSDDEPILATTVTADDGSYLFSGLSLDDGGGDSDADYLVDVTDIDGVLAGLQKTSGTAGTNNNSQADPYAFDLSAGSPNEPAADFGYAAADGTGAIGTSVWHDLDMDGVRDGGEPPIQGVTIDVYVDVDGDGVLDPGLDNRVRTVATDANGEYELKGLPFGDYLVDVTDSAGVLAGFTKTSGSAGVDDNSQADPYAVTLSAGSVNDVTADFGYRDDVVSAALAISGTVFVDADVDGELDFIDGDADGVYDPGETTTETLVQNATVELYRVVGGTPLLIGRETTDVNGFYAFDDLPTGDYEVRILTGGTSVDGFLQTTQTGSGGVQTVTLPDNGDPEDPATDNSANNNFGFYDGGVTFTPVTLSYFAAGGDQDRLVFEWKTATEVGHVGFNVWTWAAGGWRRLNAGLIPSSGVDSIEIRDYAFEARGAGGTLFLLEDVGVRGTSRYHGPFELGRSYGRRDLTNRPIDWPGIRGEHQAAKAQRRAAARERLRLEKAGDGAVRLLVDADGIYRVTYEQLAAAGLDLTGVAAADVAVLGGGAPWPVRVSAPGGVFGPGAFVELLGLGLDTLYTTTNVYTLRVDPAHAARVDDDASSPDLGPAPASYTAAARTERNRSYSFGSPTDDPWYDSGIVAFSSPASTDVPFFTEERVAGAGPVTLTVSLWGVTDWVRTPDHHVVLSVNGTQLADETFDGLVDHPVTFEVPEAVLQAGENTLRVTLPGDTGVEFDIVNVESWTVRYQRAFEAIGGALELTAAGEVFEVDGLPSADVAVYRRTGSQLERLANVQVLGAPGDYSARFAGSAQLATYHVASGPAIASPGLEPGRPEADLESGPAELLIISHPDFIAGLEPLVAARQAQQWSVKVVDVEDVYEQFGAGVFDPQAIRAYVDLARRELGTRAVLLVGGDTYDYHDHLGLGGVSFIPSLYAETGDLVRFAPADGLIADGDRDEVPDVAIGRFPVRTPAELASLIDKTLEYEQMADRKTLVMAADDYDAPTRFDFTLSSEQLAALLPADWQLDRIYLDQLDVATARAQLLSRLDAGPAVTSFMGHSGPTTWSFDGLFGATDAAALDNAGAPTVVTQWGCWTTYYVSPQNETLAHRLLLSGDRGAAAVLGATTLTEARSERVLSLEIMSRLFQPGQTLGGAILGAKRALAASESPAVLDVLLGWNLLGDPTLIGFDGELPSGPPPEIFTDGFESGDTSMWSATR